MPIHILNAGFPELIPK